ncbi:hypothetical protein SIN8267_02925 [Sinobacterium norvegicum]|uniref:DUF3014 domain-containing protein n=2 Tax=Sinobacterium norvegicum TaxID=1641715 RepID=A0ABM9AHW7_9GAMM|nr:hypothetical protein SIN8267_02925 [Sinobacterium norvegicum]
MNWKIVAPIAIIAAGGIWLVSQQPEPASPIEQPVTLPAEIDPKPPEVVVEAEPEVVEVEAPVTKAPALPPITPPPVALDNSDVTVLEAVADLSPSLGKWLIPQEQLRKWVLAIDNIANDSLPGKYSPVSYHMDGFAVSGDADTGFQMSEANFNRADKLINAVTAMDPQTVARYYQSWLPMLEEAYRELGKPGTFADSFDRASERLMAVQGLQQPAELDRPVVFYTYDDKTLEDSGDIDKLMWRLGDYNREKVQAFLIEFNKYK